MLNVYSVVVEVLRLLQPVVRAIQAHDWDLARQLRHASTSVLLNSGEGSGTRGGARRERYLTALGSARETTACIDAAVALGYVARVDVELLDKLDRVRGTLVKLVRLARVQAGRRRRRGVARRPAPAHRPRLRACPGTPLDCPGQGPCPPICAFLLAGAPRAPGTVAVASLRFDRGTLVVDGPRAGALAGVVWDDRTQNRRASAHRYADLRVALGGEGALDDPLPARWRGRGQRWSPLPLRPYQSDALAAWLGQGKRGVVVLPTGAGKTRVALAAAAAIRAPTCVLCPTRVLLGQWLTALREAYADPIGLVGDGEWRLEDVTVMTFESAFRHMDGLGDRFALLVVDEAHHFASGVRGEALEACAAPHRLGLTATAPEPGSPGERTLADLIGPVVFAMSIGDLTGSHLATFEVVRLRVSLTEDERDEYRRLSEPFRELRDGLLRAHPMLDWEATLRAMSRTAEGHRAISSWQRAVSLAAFPREKRRLAASLVERHRPDKTLVFAAHAADARAISCDSLVPAITAEIARDEREAVLARFRDGRIRCLVSARVLNEGVDVPDASVAILLGGALGVREQVQRVGRVLRPSPGKTAIVYDVATAGTVDERRSDRKWRRLAAQALPTVPA